MIAVADAQERTKIYLDELREHAVRDPERLQPGAEVIFAHVPPLNDPSFEDSEVSTYGYRATVLKVEERTFSELQPNIDPQPGEKPGLVIFYEQDSVRSLDGSSYRGHRYASDSGVIPYGDDRNSDFYNSTNFTVIVDDLRARGLEPVLEGSALYLKRLAEYNTQIDTSFSDRYADYY